jgi:hypothetical protein
MTNYRFDTKFIADIEADPRWLRRMVGLISDAIDDESGDYAWQIATDYIDSPADADTENPTAYEDAVAEQVINPLQDRLMDQIMAQFGYIPKPD